MVSLFKGAPKEDTHPARFILPLLEEVAKTAIESDHEGLTAFQKAVGEIAEALAASSLPQVTSAKLDDAIRLLTAYNARVQAYWHAHQQESRRMLSLAIETMQYLSAPGSASIEALSAAEKSFASASRVEDLKLVRAKLLGCLASVRAESARLKLDSENQLDEMKICIKRANNPIIAHLAAEPPDPVTGLVGPVVVRELISKLQATGNAFLLATLVFEQIPEMNQSLGRRAADCVMAISTQKLGNELIDLGVLVRWNGPALLLISPDISGDLKIIESRLDRLARKRIECFLELDQQAVQFRVFFSWAVQRVIPAEPARELYRKLDGFVSARIEIKPADVTAA